MENPVWRLVLSGRAPSLLFSFIDDQSRFIPLSCQKSVSATRDGRLDILFFLPTRRTYLQVLRLENFGPSDTSNHGTSTEPALAADQLPIPPDDGYKGCVFSDR